MKVSNDSSKLPFVRQKQLPSLVGDSTTLSKPQQQQDYPLFPALDGRHEELVEKANKTLEDLSTELKVTFHKDTNQLMVKIVKSQTQEVIKEIPPEKLVDLVYNLCEIAGIFTDRKI
ncbi:flagellar protein FlaG [Paenibacillus lautus]|uniref:flagellar protein FlaG n=1 Tax=Paenibacillus lautus TaxID=1401 RepID=UPI001C11B7AC|nr:flagellar protein FlaG [Paenibacillus lautus]MBU5349290.1 flagellar protein FlaG [Paenibacillus lautus]